MASFTVHADEVSGTNSRFWQAAGADRLFWETLRPEGQALLDRMERTGSCRYVRNHFTLSNRFRFNAELGFDVYTEDEDGRPHHDFSKVNRVFGEYVRRGIKPVVECGYIPRPLTGGSDDDAAERDEGLSASDRGPNDWGKWGELLRAFARNLVDQFGQAEVRTWYFEVWNEPDSWPKEDVETFFRMYDVFVAAIDAVDDKLRVGGPACYNIYFLRDFLHHVVHGRNHATGRTGVRLDFISYHIYGMSGGWLKLHPLVKPTIQKFIQEMLWIQRLIKQQFPELIGTPFHLNEWGVCSNFHRTAEQSPPLDIYRNSEYAALFFAKLVHSLLAIEDAMNFPTSMLLYWGFAGEAEFDRLFIGQRELTTAGDIPKPIQTAHEMLAMLGDERLMVHGPQAGHDLGMMATRTGRDQVQIAIYQFNEFLDEADGEERFELDVVDLPDGVWEVSGYFLDREHHNTYRTWRGQGASSVTAEADLAALRDAAELTPDSRQRLVVKHGSLPMRIAMPRHSMRVYLFRREADETAV